MKPTAVKEVQQLELPLAKINVNRSMMTIGLICAAIVALSLAAIFIRLSEEELGPFATIFNRYWIAFLALWLWHQHNSAYLGLAEKTTRQPQHYTKKDLILLGGAGVTFWGCLALWAWSLTQTSVAYSTILHNLTPLFTTLGSWIIFRHKFDNRFLIGLVIAIGGSVLLELDDLQVASGGFAGNMASLLSAVFSAASLMMLEKLRAKFPAPKLIMDCCAIGMVMSLPVTLLTENRIFPISVSGWLSVIALALVCQVIGQVLQAYNLKALSAGLVGGFLLLDPVLSTLMAWKFFGESLSLFHCFTFAVILVGIYLLQSSNYADRLIAEKA